MTHEEFVQAVADIAAAKLASQEQEKIRAIKLVYGAGPDGVRGVTYYQRWQAASATVPFVALNALHQESVVQLCGTTLHELGHVLAGWQAGHGKDWHLACDRLGLRRVRAAGTCYSWAHFAPDIREAIVRLPAPVDGKPQPLAFAYPGGKFKLKPCGAGVGTRGGKTRGVGSGSRLRLFHCECVPPVKVRVAREEFHATCDCCSMHFHRA